MESLRNVLRHNLGRSLQSLSQLDRLAAAWPVAAGTLTASRGRLHAFRNGTVEILVEDPTWLAHMQSLQPALDRDLARIAQVPIAAIHFSHTENR